MKSFISFSIALTFSLIGNIYLYSELKNTNASLEITQMNLTLTKTDTTSLLKLISLVKSENMLKDKYISFLETEQVQYELRNYSENKDLEYILVSDLTISFNKDGSLYSAVKNKQ